MFKLTPAVRFVTLALNYSDSRFVPQATMEYIKKSAGSNQNGETKKHQGPSGRPVYSLFNIERCVVAELLKGMPYEFVNVRGREQADRNKPEKKYFIVYLDFARPDSALLTDEFREIRPRLWEEILLVGNTTIWTVKRTDNNPCYINGKPVDGESSLMMNFNSREDLYKGTQRVNVHANNILYIDNGVVIRSKTV